MVSSGPGMIRRRSYAVQWLIALEKKEGILTPWWCCLCISLSY